MSHPSQAGRVAGISGQHSVVWQTEASFCFDVVSSGERLDRRGTPGFTDAAEDEDSRGQQTGTAGRRMRSRPLPHSRGFTAQALGWRSWRHMQMVPQSIKSMV
jgi:hypothetical protein